MVLYLGAFVCVAELGFYKFYWLDLVMLYDINIVYMSINMNMRYCKTLIVEIIN